MGWPEQASFRDGDRELEIRDLAGIAGYRSGRVDPTMIVGRGRREPRHTPF